MSDSFFTTQNRYDGQFATFDRHTCAELMEAGTRRLVALDGLAATARRHYRLADICAGVHVLPVEAWSRLGAIAGEPSPAKQGSSTPRRLPWLLPYCCFVLGIAAGLWLARQA